MSGIMDPTPAPNRMVDVDGLGPMIIMPGTFLEKDVWRVIVLTPDRRFYTTVDASRVHERKADHGDATAAHPAGRDDDRESGCR